MKKEHARRPYLTDQARQTQISGSMNRPRTGGIQNPSPSLYRGSIQPVFFDLLIREVKRNKPAEQWPQAQELISGRTYAFFLIGDLDSTTLQGNLCPQGVRIEEKVRIRVLLPAEIQKKGEKPVREFAFTYQEAKRCNLHFTLNLRHRIPSGIVTFSLAYSRDDTMLYKDLGQRAIFVQGSYNPENRQVLDKCQMKRGLPPKTVLLSVDFAQEPSAQDQDYRLSLYGWTSQGDLLQETAILDSLVSVEQLFRRNMSEKHDRDPEAVISTLLRFSRRFSQVLNAWLLKLIQTSESQEPLCLIIVDHTSLRKDIQLEIPWEMLELEVGEYHFLGEFMQVVRWLPFRQYRWLEVKKLQHKGALLSYVDPGLGNKRIQAEVEILAHLQTHSYSSLEDLDLRMRQSLQNIGLVYIGCHGLDGNNLRTSTDLQEPSDRLNAINLELLHPRPGELEPFFTVFLNACTSARIVGGYRTNRGSFVEGFLTNGARGFIGTLASIDIQTASTIADTFLRLTTGEDHLSIAEALRLLRVQAMEIFRSTYLLPRDKQKKELLYKVLDTFMYVYYGDPLASLYLQHAESGSFGLMPIPTSTASSGESEQEET